MDSIKISLKLCLFIVLFCAACTAAIAKNQVVNLQTEYHINPLGIDVEKPRLSWQLISNEKNVSQSAYEIRVAASASELTKKNKLLWNSGKVESANSVNIEYGGLSIPSMKRVWWQVRIWDTKGKVSAWSEAAFWETGILNTDEWEAKWINLPDEPKVKGSKPAQYFRKEFATNKKVKSARIYVTSLGLYQLFLNGEKVGDELFTPGWTSFNKRLQYQTYDVTSLLKNKNALAAILGDGWYRGYIGWKDQTDYYGDMLALLVQLKIEYTDGSNEVVVTDENWKSSTGPIVKSDIYNGEVYDARLEMEGWNKVGFNSGSWKKVGILEKAKDILIAPQGEVVKAVEELPAISMARTPKGELVYDMGQNMVGWLRIKLKGKKDQEVQLKFAEVLDKNGNFYTENLRAAECTDTYIFKADGEVVFEPKFTFHGFRYVQIIGVDEAPAKEDLTGIVIYSDMKNSGTFTCNNELINQLQHNIQWGQKGNFLDVPTDCPQRDERLGWTGDAQVFAPTAAFNFDVAAFYTKWMKDVVADQLDNGVVPHVIPDVLKGQGAATGWADAVAVIPWTVYKNYNDIRILEESYPAIKKWVTYMTQRAGDDYLWTDDKHFGDWLAFATTRSDYPGATTEKDLLATVYFYYTTNLTAKIAAILGNKQDAEKYQKLAENIKDAFSDEFVTPNGRLVSHTQTAYVLTLAFDILPENLKENAAEYLAKEVAKFKHLTTGFLGTPLLCPVLSEIGRDDLAFMLLNRKGYPSWLYPVIQGATTIWERWDGMKPDGSFQSVGMNSFNHYAYGAIGEWLYGHVAGIMVDENAPGFKHFYLAPHPGEELTKVSANYESMYGLISSDWKVEDGKLDYRVIIPANTSAKVTLPKAKLAEVKMDENLQGKQVGDVVVLELGSGEYTFSYPYEMHK